MGRETRLQYYLHNFLTSSADLNLTKPAVQQEITGRAPFWLERGVDGFRLDTINFYVHDYQLRNNPPSPAGISATRKYRRGG